MDRESLRKLPVKLQPLAFHGVEFTQEVNDGQWRGECPFCGKADHFYAHSNTGQWDCKVCGRTGNVYTFLKLFIEDCQASVTDDDYRQLSRLRKRLPWKAFRRHGLCKNASGEWLIPIRNHKGSVVNIRKWVKPHVYGTMGLDNGLWGMQDLCDPNRRSEPVFVCEGEWDAIALDWLLRKLKRQGIVVALPGASVFDAEWVRLFDQRRVFLMHDNDEAGDRGSARIAKMLVRTNTVRRVYYLNWPESRPEGYDVRDLVCEIAVLKNKPRLAMKTLLDLCRKRHRYWNNEKLFPQGFFGGPETGNQGVEVTDTGGEAESDGPPPTFDEVVAKYAEFLKMTPEAVGALRVIFGTIVSNQIGGDPVWLFIVGPAGSGKTVLLMSTSDYEGVICASSITTHTLVSGFRAEQDPSLIPQLNDKTFVLKDFTEILSKNVNEQDEIYSILRGAFDGHVKRPFGNGITREYHCHFSMLAGVTAAIHGRNTSGLGERYLKYELFRGVNTNHDHQIKTAIMGIGAESKMDAAIKPVARRFLSAMKIPEEPMSLLPEEYVDRIVSLSQIISMLRAEVERNWKNDEIKYRPQSEVGSRLAKQLSKLAIGIAVVSGKLTVDEEVYRVVEKVAVDTAVGFHLDVIQSIVRAGGTAEQSAIAKRTGIPRTTLIRILDDLSLLGVIKRDSGEGAIENSFRYAYRVTKRVRSLWARANIQTDAVRPTGKPRKFRRKKKGQSDE